MEPKVSILWLNYNSSSFIDLVLESLRAIRDLDFSNYELIVVDNGSVDDSFAIIESYIKKNAIKSKIIPLHRNFGYTGGNNVAYTSRDLDSKYIVLLNNDAVPKQDSLRKLVDCMEKDETLGSAQGVILNYDENSIDTAGDYLDEFFFTHPLLEGKLPGSLSKPVYITSADGAYSIHRVQAIRKMKGQNNNLFDDFVFACLDDYMLGLELWNSGFKVRAFPLITAKHRRGTSFNRVGALRTYLTARNQIMLHEISNSRYKNLFKLLFLKQLYGWSMKSILNSKAKLGSKELPAIFSRAFVDGTRIGRKRKKLGNTIDVYKAPILRIKHANAFLGIMIRQGFIDSSAKEELDKIACKCGKDYA